MIWHFFKRKVTIIVPILCMDYSYNAWTFSVGFEVDFLLGKLLRHNYGLVWDVALVSESFKKSC